MGRSTAKGDFTALRRLPKKRARQAPETLEKYKFSPIRPRTDVSFLILLLLAPCVDRSFAELLCVSLCEIANVHDATTTRCFFGASKTDSMQYAQSTRAYVRMNLCTVVTHLVVTEAVAKMNYADRSVKIQ